MAKQTSKSNGVCEAVAGASKGRIRQLYGRSLFRLAQEAHEVLRRHFTPGDIQTSRLISIKTGGCPEDCAYCPQAARYHTHVKGEGLMSLADVRKEAQKALAQGATRLCMGAAWREVKDGPHFERVLEMVRVVNQMGLQSCCTLGMLSKKQAERLKEAGLYAYNHNLDTSEEYYQKIITTRQYQDRLRTLKHVRQAGITVCTGGILGMGESEDDRIAFLHTLANLTPQPESVTINTLVRIPGTPLADTPPISPLIVMRVIAVARITMPKAVIRLSAGRRELSHTEQFLAFYMGANSLFLGDKLLTTPNPDETEDAELFQALNLSPKVL